jgi:hypothetical protein
MAESVFPWAGQPDEIGCNFALGHLIKNLPLRLATGGRLHADTLMAAAGAVAGLCAQISLLSDEAALAEGKASGNLAEATLTDGRKFLYGDALNAFLTTTDADLARSRVWNMLISAALSVGMPEEELPDLAAMFQHVTKVLGSDREGLPSTPEAHQPLMPVQKLLQIVAPLAFECLTGEIDPICKEKGFRANEPSWVAVTAQAAAGLLVKANEILHPGIAATIAMESAIYASKIRGNDAAAMR